MQCPFHGEAAQAMNRPDQAQLDRIEDKLDWLHWRMSPKFTIKPENYDERGVLTGLSNIDSPEPYWPGPRPKEVAGVA